MVLYTGTFFDFLCLQENSGLKREQAVPVKCFVVGKCHYCMGIYCLMDCTSVKYDSLIKVGIFISFHLQQIINQLEEVDQKSSMYVSMSLKVDRVKKKIEGHTLFKRGSEVAKCLRHYATNPQVAGSIPDYVIGIFQ